MKHALSAYILCGGKSSRMQQEKGLVEFRGKSFVQWILEAVFPFQISPVLVTKNPDYAVFSQKMTPDLIEDQGPIGGIYTALSHAETDSVLILSCDIPKITSEVLMLLLASASNSPDQITFLSDEINDYPLIGVYPKRYLRDFEQAISCGKLKLRRLVDGLPHQRLVLSPNRTAALQNINTRIELLNLSQTY